MIVTGTIGLLPIKGALAIHHEQITYPDLGPLIIVDVIITEFDIDWRVLAQGLGEVL